MSSGQFVAKAFKWVAYAANGVSPVEPNPNFAEDIRKVGAQHRVCMAECCLLHRQVDHAVLPWCCR